MSMRHQAGIVLPGYNALKVANAPTIGTATAGSTQASVTFTAPACVGGGAISSYTVFANCGIYKTSGASSPLVVTGLTNGTAYTFKAIATNAYGPSYPSAASNSVTPAIIQGQQAYTTAGTYSWVAPAGVTSVSVVAVGSGAAAQYYQPPGPAYYYPGGGGGALAYTNNATVIPGNSYAVVVGAGVCAGVGDGNFSSFACTVTKADGGKNRVGTTGGAGGTVIYGTGGGAGGAGGNGTLDSQFISYPAGSGGAGGYSGAGGAGGNTTLTGSNGSAGSGGGAGGSASGGSCNSYEDWASGGVGILGEGSSGAGGTTGSLDGAGKGGSGGSNGLRSPTRGGLYGGAKASVQAGLSGGGAVRIIWPGTTRFFPSTNTGDL